MTQRQITLLLLTAAALLTAGCPPVPEEGDPNYTILLRDYRGPGHAAVVRDARTGIEAHTEWDDLFVVHEDGASRLYKGEYVSVKGARWDLRKVQRYKVESAKPFATATIVALPSTLVGPPEHDLTRAPGEYTLVVATFYDVPEENYIGRQRFAIDHCRSLRDEGYEAYYYHSGVNSYVTVGSLTESDYRMMPTEEGAPPSKDLDYSEELIELMKRFPVLAVNGRVEFRVLTNPKTGKSEKRAMGTYVRDIPRRPGSYE